MTWIPLPGATIRSCSVARNFDGRLEVFAVRPDNTVCHIWQRTPVTQSSGGQWSGWSDLGGGIVGDLAVAPNVDGRLEVFGKGIDGTAWHIWQQAPGKGWSNWASLGGNVSNFLAAKLNGTVGSGGRCLELFSVLNRSVRHIRQEKPGGGWGNWNSLGGNVNEPIAVGWNSNPLEPASKEGRLEVFGIEGGNLKHIWQLTPGGSWSAWESLGGGSLTGLVAVTDGGLNVYALKAGNYVTNRQVHSMPNANWVGWTALPALGTQRNFFTGPIAGRDEVFAVGNRTIDTFDGLFQVYHTSEAAGNWSNWQALGTNFAFISHWISLAYNAADKLEVFSISAAGELFHKWQTPNGWNS